MLNKHQTCALKARKLIKIKFITWKVVTKGEHNNLLNIPYLLRIDLQYVTSVPILKQNGRTKRSAATFAKFLTPALILINVPIEYTAVTRTRKYPS